jgi:hypothetical protein
LNGKTWRLLAAAPLDKNILLVAHWEYRERDAEVFSLKKNFAQRPPAVGIRFAW